MANPALRLPVNVPGDFFIDSRCIDCEACNWIAPASFAQARNSSRVFRQPATSGEIRRAEMALLACPVGAIGTEAKHDLDGARADFPEPVDANVHYCGYHAGASFGAASYFIRRPDGNVLIDSPRFAGPLVERLEALGGVRYLFLTHRDDIADQRRFRKRFGCARIMHRADLSAATRDVEIVIEGEEASSLASDLTVIPVPGHTKGSIALLHAGRHLFSGDHLAWSEELGRIVGFRDACWYDWAELRRSAEKLLSYRFEWLFPGHGRRCHFAAETMATELGRALAWMEAA